MRATYEDAASSEARDGPAVGSLADALRQAGYRVLHTLGAGGGGRVYKAIQQSTGQSVAIKVLGIQSPGTDIRERRIERFRREISVCSTLYHPDIVRLCDSGSLDANQFGPDQYFAVFEFVPGMTLAELLRREGTLGVQRARSLLLQLLAPLAYAHDKGIAHRDLKPANIMITPDGDRDRLKVLDFGISIATSEPELGRLTLSHEWVGTPTYAAPEQLRGESSGLKADLYAWGLIFVECLTGTPLIVGRSLPEIVQSQLQPEPHALPAPLAQHRLGKLLARVLEKDLARRAADVALIRSLLERIPVGDLEGPGGYLRDVSRAPLERAPRSSDTLTDGHSDEQIELINATVVSTRLDWRGESRSAAEQVDAVLADATGLMEEVLRQFGARPVQSLGLCSLGFFGLTHAREEDARMALRAALELASRCEVMQRWLEDHGLSPRLRIGIHHGPVSTQLAGAARQPIHGLSSGIAMRLAEQAEHSDQAASVTAPVSASTRILVTDAFRQLVSRHAELEEFPRSSGAAAVTGPVYRIIGESRLPQRDTERAALVGRDSEFASLRAAWLSSRSAGAGLLLVGEAGIGKSRLARELVRELETQSVRWLQARCLPEWQSGFLRPLTELLATLLGLPQLASADAVARLVRRVQELGLPSAECVPLLCVALSLPMPQGQATPAWSPQKQRQLLHEHLADLLIAEMEHGAALLIEDLQWADPSTLECLDTLLQRAQRRSAFVLLTSRPGARFTWAAAPAELHLGRLDDAAIETLAAGVLSEGTLGRPLLDQVVRRSDGVPLFAEELALALLESASLGQSTLHPGQTARAETAVPLSLRALLASRLEGLGAARQTARFAAALGREFSLELLCAVLQEDELVLLADLEQLVSAQILIKRRRVDSPLYAFRHALIRDSACDGMPSDERREIHRRVAIGIERHCPELAVLQPDILARHFEFADEPAKALSYWAAAARRSQLASAHLEALHQLDRALGLAEALPASPTRDDQLSELLLARATTLVAKRGYTDPEARSNFERVSALLSAANTSPRLAFAARFGLWHYHSKRVDGASALAAAKELEAIAHDAGDDALLVCAYQALCHSHFVLGELDLAVRASRACEATYDFERHRELAIHRGDDPHLSALSFEAVAELLRGSPELAIARVRQALALAERLAYPAMSAGIHCQAAWMYLLWGTSGASQPDVLAAREHAAHGLRLAREHGFPFWEVISVLMDAAARGASGDPSALADLLGAVQIRRLAGATLGECWQSVCIGVAQRSLGRYRDAISAFEAALSHCESSGSGFFEAEARRNLAEALCDPQNPEPQPALGRLAFERAEATAAQHGALWTQLSICVSRVRLDAAAADVRRLGSLLERYTVGSATPPLVREARQLYEALTSGREVPPRRSLQ